MTQGIVVIVVYLQRIDVNQTKPGISLCAPEIAAVAVAAYDDSHSCYFYGNGFDDIFHRIQAS